jgi:hypothetical protein
VFEGHRSDLHVGGSVIIVTLGAILQGRASGRIERKVGLGKGSRSARRPSEPTLEIERETWILKAFPWRRVTFPPLGGVNEPLVRKGTFVGMLTLNAGPENVTPSAAPGS